LPELHGCCLPASNSNSNRMLRRCHHPLGEPTQYQLASPNLSLSDAQQMSCQVLQRSCQLVAVLGGDWVTDGTVTAINGFTLSRGVVQLFCSIQVLQLVCRTRCHICLCYLCHCLLMTAAQSPGLPHNCSGRRAQPLTCTLGMISSGTRDIMQRAQHPETAALRFYPCRL
jgi:hypothetical protein